MSKPKTYPIVEQIQSNDIRRIYQSINPNAAPYRTLGASNSNISKELFPASPFHSNITNAELTKSDRGKLLVDRKIDEPNSPLTDDLVTQMFATVIDGSSAGSHVKAFGNNNNNYSWLYRDKPMDMNFAYLDKDGNPQAPTGSSDVENEPGGNATITTLADKPHWGYPNINVINNDGDTFSTNPQRNETPSLSHASNGFGTPVERPFSTRETIGTYFTSVHVTGKTQVLGSSIPDTPVSNASLKADVIASLPYDKTAMDSIQNALSQGVVRQAITNRQIK